VKKVTDRADFIAMFRQMMNVAAENPGVPFENILKALFPDWVDFFQTEPAYYLR